MFGFIEGQDRLPDWLERIAFLDAVYNFEPKHGDKLAAWLRRDAEAHARIVAYDDREIMLDGKKVVSDSGGTWRASQRMLTYFRPTIALTSDRLGEFLRYHNDQIEILLHPNPANRILHTEMIGEMNAYMHALLVRRADYERGASVLVTKRAYTDWTDGEVVLPPAAPLQGASAHTDHVDITWFSVTNMYPRFRAATRADRRLRKSIPRQ